MKVSVDTSGGKAPLRIPHCLTGTSVRSPYWRSSVGYFVLPLRLCCGILIEGRSVALSSPRRSSLGEVAEQNGVMHGFLRGGGSRLWYHRSCINEFHKLVVLLSWLPVFDRVLVRLIEIGLVVLVGKPDVLQCLQGGQTLAGLGDASFDERPRFATDALPIVCAIDEAELLFGHLAWVAGALLGKEEFSGQKHCRHTSNGVDVDRAAVTSVDLFDSSRRQ